MTTQTNKVIKAKRCTFMPKVFNENDKNLIRENLIKFGLEALESNGYKAASVEKIANQAGIAKGTFYNFFQSKEQFFYEVMLSIRDKNRNDFYEFLSTNSKIDKESMKKFLFERYANKKNIYHYFTSDEFNIIFRKTTDRLSLTNIDSINFSDKLLAGIPNVNSRLNNEVVVNVINIIGRFAADKDLVSVESREETIEILANALACYIFEEA